MTELVRANSIRVLPSVRVTSVAHLAKCPRSWRAQITMPGELAPSKRDSPYATMGTAVHKVVEHHLRGDNIDRNAANLFLAQAGVSEIERDKMWDYINTLSEANYPQRALAIEDEFVARAPGMDVVIIGHRDLVVREPDGGVTVVDHKTNRRYEGVSWWERQLQQRLYAWATRKQYPDARYIAFEIGYVNLGMKVRWECDPDDAIPLEAELARLWERALEADASDQWPERFNDDCGYCPLRSNCGTYEANFNALLTSFDSAVKGMTMAQQYDWVQRVRKAAESHEDMIRAQLAARVAEAEQGVLREGGFEFRLEERLTRRAKATEVLPVLIAAGQDPIAAGAIRELWDQLLTIKVGGLDALTKKVPYLKALLSGVVRKEPGDTPSLKVRKIGE